jgi:16S rRNA (cytosine967-C5)-methyltransferase
MTPSARIQSSIELLGDILLSWESEKRFPADKIIDRFFKSRRFIGSKDRAYIGELVYWVLRNLALAEYFANEMNARLLVLASLMIRKDFNLAELNKICDGTQYAPELLASNEAKTLSKIPLPPYNGIPRHVRLNYPEWIEEKLQESFGEKFERATAALNEQAPTDLRTNTLKSTREALIVQLISEGFECGPTPNSPIGIRLKKRGPIFTSEVFKQGHFEVQDEGSQMVAGIVDAEPGMRVIDFCAGAGGKTLAIAAQMQNKGRVLAWDNSEKRLSQIKDRIKRAGADNIQIHVIESENDAFIKRHKQTADRVLVDAPCSGTGTWRRNPDLKWRFTKKDLDEMLSIQASILHSAARLVKPGGRLIYATCSVLKDENDHQVANFLKNNDNFRVVCAEKIWSKLKQTNGPLIQEADNNSNNNVSYLWVTPHQDGVDGFFAAVLERK